MGKKSLYKLDTKDRNALIYDFVHSSWNSSDLVEEDCRMILPCFPLHIIFPHSTVWRYAAANHIFVIKIFLSNQEILQVLSIQGHSEGTWLPDPEK